MSSFKDQNWGTRYNTMGDMAEGQYETWADEAGDKWVRYGLNRPRASMTKWSPFIRYTPDYILHDRLVEVKGCGRDGLVKIKTENIAALAGWRAISDLPVWLFIYNSSEDDIVYFEMDDTFYTYLHDVPKDRFPDNDKEFYNIPWKDCVNQTWNPW